jgi:two-component system, NarL family, sensor histidine kinase LiaS
VMAGIEPAVEQELLRISVEALANVVRHASAAHAHVSLTHHGDTCILLIVDDGIGFDVTQPRPGHLGAATMRERAHRIGAQFDLHSRSGHGTRISVTVPLPNPRTPTPTTTMPKSVTS